MRVILPRLIGMMIALIAFPFLMSSRKWQPREAIGTAVSLLATRDGIRLQTPQATQTYGWDAIVRYKHNEAVILLYTQQQGSYHLIPRHWFASANEWGELRALVEQRVGLAA